MDPNNRSKLKDLIAGSAPKQNDYATANGLPIVPDNRLDDISGETCNSKEKIAKQRKQHDIIKTTVTPLYSSPGCLEIFQESQKTISAPEIAARNSQRQGCLGLLHPISRFQGKSQPRKVLVGRPCIQGELIE